MKNTRISLVKKFRLTHNFVRVDDYDKSWHPDRLFTLGIIGILPSRKGYKKALEILKELKACIPRFNLKVFGKRAEDLHWVANNPAEMSYFSECKEYIEKNGLSDSVEYVGHVDIQELSRQKVGYILSVSDHDLDFPGPESFHLAIADGFSAGAVSLVLHWPGCEYIWPGSAVFESKNDIVDELLRLKNNRLGFLKRASEGEGFIKENYDIDGFVEKVNDRFLEII